MKVKMGFRGGIWHEGRLYRWEAGQVVDMPEEAVRALGKMPYDVVEEQKQEAEPDAAPKKSERRSK